MEKHYVVQAKRVVELGKQVEKAISFSNSKDKRLSELAKMYLKINVPTELKKITDDCFQIKVQGQYGELHDLI